MPPLKHTSWETTTAIERRWEPLLDAVFATDFLVVKATRQHQRQKIDRFFIDRNDARNILRVDYKFDEVADDTGNIALEETSVKRGARIIDKGWVHTTIADWIISYLPRHDVAYVLPVAFIRRDWPIIQKTFRLRETGTTRGRSSYTTELYAVPIPWLKDSGTIQSELKTAGSQLRLVLTTRRSCPGNDPLCPCQDFNPSTGKYDMCHYEGPNAWPIPSSR